MVTPLFLRSQLLLLFLLLGLVFFAVAVPSPACAKNTLVIDKARKELVVFSGDRLTARFPVSFGIDPVSDKRKAHDCATPEGVYSVTYKKTQTRFHRLLGISYPGMEDAEKGLAAGNITLKGYGKLLDAARKGRPMPCNTGLGCGIAIHGGGVYRHSEGTTARDWTEGCIALDNRDIDVLFNASNPGDDVVIFDSSRNLYGMARPFARVAAFDDSHVPVCPDGVCTYLADFPTSLGRVVVEIREGKFGMSLQVSVHPSGMPGTSFVSVVDRNADGELSFLDSVHGSFATGEPPEATYAKIRDAVAEALAQGAIPRTASGR